MSVQDMFEKALQMTDDIITTIIIIGYFNIFIDVYLLVHHTTHGFRSLSLSTKRALKLAFYASSFPFRLAYYWLCVPYGMQRFYIIYRAAPWWKWQIAGRPLRHDAYDLARHAVFVALPTWLRVLRVFTQGVSSTGNMFEHRPRTMLAFQLVFFIAHVLFVVVTQIITVKQDWEWLKSARPSPQAFRRRLLKATPCEIDYETVFK